MATVDLLLNSRCVLGESPVWANDSLTFIDIMSKRVHQYLPKDRSWAVAELSQQVGTVVGTAGGALVAALEDCIVGPFNMPSPGRLGCSPADAAPASAVVEAPVIAKLPNGHHQPGMRFNDGKVSPEGILITGTMHKSWRDPAAPKGRLYALVGLELHVMLEGVTLTNGMDWSADGRTFFYVDSATQRVDAFDYTPGAGGKAPPSLTNRRTVVTVPALGTATPPGIVAGVPDGMALDFNGNIWVALGESGHVVQYDYTTGQQLLAVRLPVARPTACSFGHPDLSILYVTTREEPAAPGGLVSDAHGGVFAVRVPGIRGGRPPAALQL